MKTKHKILVFSEETNEMGILTSISLAPMATQKFVQRYTEKSISVDSTHHLTAYPYKAIFPVYLDANEQISYSTMTLTLQEDTAEYLKLFRFYECSYSLPFPRVVIDDADAAITAAVGLLEPFSVEETSQFDAEARGLPRVRLTCI
jgi:hypothetical protein